jgi:hypothetical protein
MAVLKVLLLGGLAAAFGCRGPEGGAPEDSVPRSDDSGPTIDDSDAPPDDSADDSGTPLTDDVDGDGWTVNEGDCDDTDPAIHPDAEEVDGDLVDDNCDGTLVTEVLHVGDASTSFVGDDVDLYAGAGLAFFSDVTGDGLPDVAIGAPTRQSVESNDPLTGLGRAYLLSGSWAGVSTPADAVTRIQSDDRYDGSGSTITAVGDLDDDGFDDIAFARPGGAETWDGYVHIFAGPVVGELTLSDDADRLQSTHDRLGAVVVGLDGSDWALSAPDLPGNVYVVSGIPSEGSADGAAYAIFTGDDEDAPRTGWSFDRGDFDGDGITDLAIGSPYLGDDEEGGVTLVPGPWSGESIVTDAGLTWNGTSANEYGGDSVRSVGDVDADGRDDTVIGAPGRCEQAFLSGAAYVVLGETELIGSASLADAALRVEGENEYDALGDETLALTDIDGDGDPDVGIGATRLYDRNSLPPPRIYVALSPLPTGVVSAGELDAAWIGSAGEIGAGVPYAITHAFAAGGDLDSDGVPELLVGAPMATVDGLDDAGAVYIVEGLPF